MFRNYFTTAWRNLSRNATHAFINIAGLSIGLACAMLIFLYLKDEVSFDKFHHNVNNIYRVVSSVTDNGNEYQNSNTGYLQGVRFQQNVPGIQSFVRVADGQEDIRTGSEIHSQEVLYVDSSFFSVFTFPLLGGDPKTCLRQPHSIVLSEDAAEKQFGTLDAVGKVILLRQDNALTPYNVTAVARRCPQNSSLQFDVLLPLKESDADANNDENWFSVFLNTFVVLQPQANLATVERQMQRFYAKDATPAFNRLNQRFGNHGGNIGTYSLQPFTDMHLNTVLSAQNGLADASNPKYSYILSAIALFVLLIACINFVNLTVARSLRRAKEIGIRKVIGSSRRQLIVQFLGESFLLCSLAFVLAVLIVQTILPLFNHLANKALSFSYLLDANLVAGYLLLLLITGMLAGFYPALVLSGYQPVETLYSRFNLHGKNYLQKSLVVIQFALASFLIIATFTINEQFNFLTKADLGYDDHNLILVDKRGTTHKEAALFKAALLENANITDVAPNDVGHSFTFAKLGNDSSISFNYATVDASYLPELKIPIIQGRNFSNSFPGDSNHSVLVNESFVKQAGWKNPVGETVNFFYRNEIYHVVGVVKDYHYAGLDQEIGNQLFTMKNDNLYETFYIKIKPNTAAKSLKYIQKSFKAYFPLSPFSYVFKDDANRKNYEAEEKWKEILLFGALLTIFISCIGLFGLSVLSAQKRTKEIGIRKVLGASVKDVVTILSMDFLRLVIIALIIAIPPAWIAANQWLEKYPYRISLGWQLFTEGALLVILIAGATVSFQAVKAAIANPVKSLRSE